MGVWGAIAVFGALPCLAPAQGTVVTVTGEGVSSEAARRDALRKAVETGAGVEISSQSETKNFELIRDTIRARSDGLVRNVSVLAQGERGGGVFYCTVRAEVVPGGVKAAWSEVQQLLERIGRPKVMVHISESIDRVPQTSSILESKIEERLIKLGFEVFDSRHLGELATREATDAASRGQADKQAALAKNFATQVFVIGQANADYAETVNASGVELVMYNCDVQAKTFYTDTGQLLASHSLPSTRGGARGFTQSSPQAGKMAIGNAAEPLIDEVYAQVMKSWATQTSAGGEIHVEVTGLGSVADAYELKKRFRDVPGVEAVTGPEYTDGVAQFRLRTAMTAEALMEEQLIGAEWRRVLQVSEVKLRRIQARWQGQ